MISADMVISAGSRLFGYGRVRESIFPRDRAFSKRTRGGDPRRRWARGSDGDRYPWPGRRGIFDPSALRRGEGRLPLARRGRPSVGWRGARAGRSVQSCGPAPSSRVSETGCRRRRSRSGTGRPGSVSTTPGRAPRGRCGVTALSVGAAVRGPKIANRGPGGRATGKDPRPSSAKAFAGADLSDIKVFDPTRRFPAGAGPCPRPRRSRT